MSKIIPNKKLKKHKALGKEAILADYNLRHDFDVAKKAFLYRFVYSSRFSMSVVILLIVSFSLQSAERIYADDFISTETEILATDNIATEESVFSTEVDSEDIVALNSDKNLDSTTTEVSSEQVISDVIDTDENLDNVLESTASEEEINLDGSEVATTSENISEESTDSPAINSNDIPQSENDSEVAEEELDDTVSDITEESSNEIISEDDSVELATTTEVIDQLLIEQETTFETVSVTQSDSEFSFSKEECTQLATGSFYCLEPQENRLSDALFSAPDSDGDLEIFLVREGVQVQVTNNQVDDAAPYYDQNSNTLVWHRLVEDVYQVISYDPETQVETQITNTNENNMEPTRQGDNIVWQRWVDNGWNIILFDGEEEHQITHNTNHNVAPYIHGSLVVWNSRNHSGEKTIEMFDVKSGTYVTVDDPDGLSVSNPRMVFVYDSLHPNGDIVTKGYDVLAKKFIDLDTLPRELPDELPSSDSTGETRALIQSKPTVKSETEEITGTSTPSILPPVPLDNASNTDEMTLDLSNSSSTDSLDSINNFEPTEFDIVIEPFVNSDATSSSSVQE